VSPTHRRRGILRQLIGALHADARDRDEPLAMLTASESNIYGRFGYGVATWRLGFSAERARIAFRDDAVGGRMRLLERSDAEVVLPALYDRIRPSRAGMVSRPSVWWPAVFWDQFAQKGSAFFVAVHTNHDGVDDGYVGYEIKGEWHGGLPDRDLIVLDMQAADARARAALWRYVFGIDLVANVRVFSAPIDDPLRHLVTDGRRVRVSQLNDGLWIAPLDVARVLGARAYAVPGRLTVEVHAPDGTTACVELDGGPDGARCTPIPATNAADIVCPTATLGAAVLGGTRWTELADAGLVQGTRDVLLRADAMFMTSPAPAMLSAF
jgi:predicted acetyltransferase